MQRKCCLMLDGIPVASGTLSLSCKMLGLLKHKHWIPLALEKSCWGPGGNWEDWLLCVGWKYLCYRMVTWVPVSFQGKLVVCVYIRWFMPKLSNVVFTFFYYVQTFFSPIKFNLDFKFSAFLQRLGYLKSSLIKLATAAVEISPPVPSARIRVWVVLAFTQFLLAESPHVVCLPLWYPRWLSYRRAV